VTDPADIEWKAWGALLLAMAGVATAVLALWNFYKKLRHPHFRDAVFDAMKEQPERIKRWMEGDAMFGPEIANLREFHARAEANTAAVVAIKGLLERQQPLVERYASTMTEVGGQIGQLAKSIEHLAGQMDEQRKQVARQGEDIAHMRGTFDAHYTGPERRAVPHGRRESDSHDPEV
jgi:hypothetical protein